MDALKAGRIALVALANNHIYDYGADGLEETLATCNDSGIQPVGAEKDLKSSQETFFEEVKGKTIGIVNFAENGWSNANGSQGGSNPMDAIDNTYQIREASEKADISLVIMSETAMQVQE